MAEALKGVSLLQLVAIRRRRATPPSLSGAGFILRNPDGALVARFPRNVDADEVRLAGEEDRQERG